MKLHRRGDATEATVLAKLKQRNIPVSIPFGDNERYDLVIESPNKGLLAAQITTGWISDGIVEFHGKSSHTNATGNVYKKYDDDVDFFLVYAPEIETMYLIREDEFETRMTLRVTESQQRQPSINWAEDYEFDTRWPQDCGK